MSSVFILYLQIMQTVLEWNATVEGGGKDQPMHVPYISFILH
jgi:hypothetical protein